jgi:hypothetical protein
MTIHELQSLRRQLFTEAVSVYTFTAKASQPASDALESLAAIRHLYEMTCREIDIAVVAIGPSVQTRHIKNALEMLSQTRGFDSEGLTDISEAMAELQQALYGGPAS